MAVSEYKRFPIFVISRGAFCLVSKLRIFGEGASTSLFVKLLLWMGNWGDAGFPVTLQLGHVLGPAVATAALLAIDPRYRLREVQKACCEARARLVP